MPERFWESVDSVKPLLRSRFESVELDIFDVIKNKDYFADLGERTI